MNRRRPPVQLYESNRHEPLTATRWSETRARETIERIVGDTNRAFSAEGWWPIHPFDRSPERPPDSLKPIYYGAAGVIWALQYLDETGAAALQRDYLPTVRKLLQRHRDDLEKYAGVREYMGRVPGAFLIGELGFLLLNFKLEPSDELARLIERSIAAGIGDMRGLVWGGSGAMLAALFMHQRTSESRWRDLYLRHFDALWNQWEYDEEVGCHLWMAELYGVREQRLGALHGFMANALPIIAGRDLLPPQRREESLGRIFETLRTTAAIDGAYANWPNNIGASNRPSAMPLLVQHCNGSPGIINCTADLSTDPRWNIDGMFRQAGELIWRAGPPVKMPVLCHGAAGSGYALLKLYARTSDDEWLDRARRFAMHAIEQNERALAQYGQRKYSLWTGDLGLAIFLWDCIRASAKFPTLEVFL